ncbi:response regulator [Paenibacillus sp. LMG 31458]|uniref:Response regulator n=1 Tax=Paenibacillus phytorum TaxID=2654977 RepID=A0ABX1XRS7_9BACL|nr:response regulator [Paenibacillus phytorum]NOU71231.1 response regulator [Paenibacillus phytorum]
MSQFMRKVIIVDDEPMIREGLNSMIAWESLGFEVVGLFEDGEDAWAFLQTHKQIDLVITDIQMDICTGLELLRRVRRADYRSRVLIISGYDEFHYLREAMTMGIDNYLLKPINKDELISSLGQIQESLLIEYRKSQELFEGTLLMKNNILNQIVMNNYSIRDVIEKCEMLNIDLQEGGFQVVVMDTITRQRNVSLLAERQLCEFAIRNVAQESIGENGIVYIFGNQSSQTIFLFAGINQSSQAAISNRMEDIAGLILNVLKIQVVAFIGRPCAFWRDIHLSYQSAMELYDYRYFVDTASIIDYTKKDRETKKEAFSKELGISQLNQLLEKQAYEETLIELERFGERFREILVPDVHIIRTALIDFALRCLSKLREMEFEILEHASDFQRSVDELFYADSKEKLYEHFWQIASTLLQTLQKLKMNRNTNIVEKVIKFIDAHYMEGLTLQQLSQQFHISAPYLGKRLKIELGQQFNEYLHHVRINKAKNLLLISDENAKDIAEKVGYTETNYFYSQFKRITGKSPMEFKKGI